MNHSLSNFLFAINSHFPFGRSILVPAYRNDKGIRIASGTSFLLFRPWDPSDNNEIPKYNDIMEYQFDRSVSGDS